MNKSTWLLMIVFVPVNLLYGAIAMLVSKGTYGLLLLYGCFPYALAWIRAHWLNQAAYPISAWVGLLLNIAAGLAHWGFLSSIAMIIMLSVGHFMAFTVGQRRAVAIGVMLLFELALGVFLFFSPSVEMP